MRVLLITYVEWSCGMLTGNCFNQNFFYLTCIITHLMWRFRIFIPVAREDGSGFFQRPCDFFEIGCPKSFEL